MIDEPTDKLVWEAMERLHTNPDWQTVAVWLGAERTRLLEEMEEADDDSNSRRAGCGFALRTLFGCFEIAAKTVRKLRSGT